MSCPALEQLAAGEADDHAAGCSRCAALADDQRAIRELARALPAPVLAARRRASLAAEVLAAADEEPRRASRVPAIAGGLAVAATLAVLLLALHTSPPVTIAVIEPPPSQPLVVSEPAPPMVAPAKSSVAAEIAGSATFTRAKIATRDTLKLHDGEVVIDARDREPVAVIARDTTIAIANARVAVTARGGVIVATRVFAGSVEVTAGGAHHVLETGEVWTRPPDREPSPAAVSLAAFRAGWEALRAGRNAEAIAAFDRATDDVVAEDAMFWAAVAAERAGHADAAARLRAFLARFPASPHAEAARGKL